MLNDEKIVSKERASSSSKGDQMRKPVKAPDGGFGWIVVIASLFASLLGDGVIFSFGVLTTEFVKHYGASRTTVGLMGSTLVGVSLAVGPLATIMCEKWNYRVVTAIGAVIAAIGFSAPFFFDNFIFLIVMGSVVTGIGLGLIYFTSLVIVNIYFDKKKGIALGIAVCGSGIGTFILSPLIEFLIEFYGWSGAMLVVGAIILNCIPCGLFYRTLTSDSDSEEDVESPLENEPIESPETNISLLSVLVDPIFILFALSNFLTNLGFNGPYLYAKDRAMSSGIEALKSSYLIASIGIGNTLGRLIFGSLATIKRINTLHMYNGSLVISGGILIISWGAINYYWMISYTFLYGLMTGSCITLTTVILGDLLGKEKLTASFALLNIIQGVALFIGPPIIGSVYDATSSFDAAFAVCGGFIAISGLIMYGGYFSKKLRKAAENC